MSDFFERLVESRRDGTAPPQVAQAEPEPPVEIVFHPSFVPGAWSCGECWSLVEARLTDSHAARHRETGE